MSKAVLELNTDVGDARRIAFSLDGGSIAGVGHAGQVYLWKLAPTAELRRYHPGPDESLGPMHGVAISPDGSKVAAATWSGPIVVWEVSAEDRRSLLPGHRYSANCVVYSPSGQDLISSGNDGRIKVWNAAAAKKRPRLSVNAHSEVVETVAVSPNGRYVAWGGGIDGRSLGVWVLDLRSKTEVPVAACHRDDVAAVAFSPCSKFVASGSWDNSVKLFDLSSQEERMTLTPPQNTTINSVSFSPDGRLLAAGGHGGFLDLWRIPEGRLIRSWPAHHEILWCVLFSPTGEYVASCGYEGAVRLWSLNE